MVQSQGHDALTIGKLAAAGGVGVETIRFYQRRGLIETPPRDGGMRRYSRKDVRRLKFIRQAQTAGFTLQEIKELLALDESADRERARELATSRLATLDTKIADLQRARDALQHLATECAEGTQGPCSILSSFKV